VGNGFFSYYLTQVLIWDLSSVNFGLAVSLFIVSVLALLWAWLMKLSSALSFLTFGILLMVIVAPGMFISSASDSIWFFAFYLGYILANSFVTATMFCYMFSLLPTHVRCTGMSVAWNVSVALFGGTALLVAEFLTKNLGYFMPGWYITVIGLMSLCILHGPDLYNKMTNKRI
jgi:MHS family proline/betaine transporter-like MFS transporter